MTSKNNEIIIKKLNLLDSSRLSKLFSHAIDHDFDYIHRSHILDIKSSNRLNDFIKASINPSRLIFLAYYKKQLVGYIIAGINIDYTGYIDWIYVDKTYRKKNIGKDLLGEVLGGLSTKKVSCVSLITHNQTDFYTKRGFRHIKSVESYGVRHNLMSINLV